MDPLEEAVWDELYSLACRDDFSAGVFFALNMAMSRAALRGNWSMALSYIDASKHTAGASKNLTLQLDLLHDRIHAMLDAKVASVQERERV